MYEVATNWFGGCVYCIWNNKWVRFNHLSDVIINGPTTKTEFRRSPLVYLNWLVQMTEKKTKNLSNLTEIKRTVNLNETVNLKY